MVPVTRKPAPTRRNPHRRNLYVEDPQVWEAFRLCASKRGVSLSRWLVEAGINRAKSEGVEP